MRILFLDIDGVFIPSRAYTLANQTKPLVTVFDPCVVGMVNNLCEKFDVKLAIHSSWCRSVLVYTNCTPKVESVMEHMVNQGLKAEYFHEDAHCKWRFSGDRWQAIYDWLGDHPEVTDYWVLDDELCPREIQAFHDEDKRCQGIVQTPFEEGLTFAQYQSIYWRLSELCGTK